jgi:hypothetical protein
MVVIGWKSENAKAMQIRTGTGGRELEESLGTARWYARGGYVSMIRSLAWKSSVHSICLPKTGMATAGKPRRDLPP